MLLGFPVFLDLVGSGSAASFSDEARSPLAAGVGLFFLLTVLILGVKERRLLKASLVNIAALCQPLTLDLTDMQGSDLYRDSMMFSENTNVLQYEDDKELFALVGALFGSFGVFLVSYQLDIPFLQSLAGILAVVVVYAFRRRFHRFAQKLARGFRHSFL